MKQRLLTYTILAFLIALFSYGLAYAEPEAEPQPPAVEATPAETVDIKALETELNIQIIVLKSIYWDITQAERAFEVRYNGIKEKEFAPLLERKLEVENKIKELRGEIEAAK